MGLVVDKLTGNIYLFDFSGGGGGTGTTAPYSEVNLYSQLPAAASHNGEIYIVRQSSGVYVVNRKESGMYYSNGVSWSRLGDIPSFFNDDNFQVYDGTDNTKRVRLQLSGLTTNSLRTITVRNFDGTLAYLSDIGAKLDTSVFNTYTGVTAPSQYLGIPVFNSYTANTENRLTDIETVLAGLTGGTPSSIHAIQVVDLVGGINVNNITPTSIQWTNVEFSGNSLTYTGASRIYIQSTGQYEISYNLVLKNGTNTKKTIGSVIRVNGNIDITPLSVSSFIDNGTTITGSNNISNYKKTLNAGQYLELIAFRIGANGSVTTIPAASFIRIIKT